MGPWGPRVRKFDGAFSPEGCGIALGHTFGVRVLKMDRPDGRRVLKFDGLSGRGLWYRPQGDEYEVSVTGLAVCVICDTISSATYFLVSP